MISTQTPSSPVTDRWAIAAYELALEEGLAALSTRALASRMGGSPSAINYHFGNREQLIGTVCAQAVAASAAWRARHQGATAVPMPIWIDLAGGFSTLLQLRIEESRSLLALLRELEQEAMASGWADIASAMANEEDAEATFWQQQAIAFGATPEQAALWADLALALSSMGLALSSSAYRSPWISGAAVRLQQRLAGEPVTLVPDRVQEGTHFDTSPNRYNETAMRILDAALAAIAEKGADRLNQRDVAARAGVSLSAVTYFFGTKHQLVGTAFEELCRQQYHAMTDTSREPGRDEMIEILSAANGSASLAAMEVLMCAGLRHPTLVPAVHRMLTIRGVGSEALLAKLGFSVDRLDGYLWISMATGRYRRVYNQPLEMQQQALRDAGALRIKALFDQVPEVVG
ncbi:MAG TPA: TetR family transcriptional regulator [Novosphingobium sp.]|nr:TetR family transcriptional regulator [Novosphingobium sp.]HZV08385.1 TetR family transcriptional regulator [Novosphingobium sp.]